MGGDATVGKRGGKSANAFRTISEVSTDLDVPQHVLRFWEGKFSQLRPMKRAGGRRYYRPEDVLLLTRIRDLLYSEGYTIRGVQKLLREKGIKRILAEEEAGKSPSGNTFSDDEADLIAAIKDAGGHTGGERVISPTDRMELVSIFEELKAIRDLLRQREKEVISS